MKGQLWQECYCGNEPVCCACEKCDKHCTCGQLQKPKVTITAELFNEPYRKGIGQGFGPGEDGDL
jgi:hypothetical protein